MRAQAIHALLAVAAPLREKAEDAQARVSTPGYAE